MIALSTLWVLWNQSWERGSTPIWIWWFICFPNTSTFLKISLMILPFGAHNMDMRHDVKLWFYGGFTYLGKLYLEILLWFTLSNQMAFSFFFFKKIIFIWMVTIWGWFFGGICFHNHGLFDRWHLANLAFTFTFMFFFKITNLICLCR